MKSTKKSNIGPEQVKAVAYARVSSKEQEKEGYSIPAQQKALREYAERKGIVIVREFVDVETAKQSGRTHFGEMIAVLKADPTIKTLLVEKTDRLHRNMKDWLTVDELDLEVHFVKEGEVISKDSRSSAKFMHGIKVLMAKQYIDNLSEEAKKGMQEKAEQGIWPSKAPLGYANVTAQDGRKVIAVDMLMAPYLKTLFETFGAGRHSLKQVAQHMCDLGFRYPRSGRPVPVSTIHTILRNRLYTGDFAWKGQVCKGTHQPLISVDLWQQVQDVLDGRNVKRQKRMKHSFAFSGLIACGHCGCSLVGEMKKGRYTYYHCTGFKGKCPEPYVREEVLEKAFSSTLGTLHFDTEILDWVRQALRESHVDERREHEEAIVRLQIEYNRLQSRIDAMYVDKLDGRITTDFFDRRSEEWRNAQTVIRATIGRHENANCSYIEDGVRILELAQSARKLFDLQDTAEKRRLLDFVVSNSVWKAGALSVTYRQPFDLIAETALKSEAAISETGLESAKSEIWLGY